jgi:hypothetical protein
VSSRLEVRVGELESRDLLFAGGGKVGPGQAATAAFRDDNHYVFETIANIWRDN